MAPFIHIAALRRSGSTIVSESLTSFPNSFIFVEPKLSRGDFAIQPHDAALFLKHGIDLKAFAKKWAGSKHLPSFLRRNAIMTAFARELVPQLMSVFEQIGVKEIHHDGWKLYAGAFPNRKVVLTGRDPRDIFISTYQRVRAGKDRFRVGFSARELARNLNRTFKHQRTMSDAQPAFKLRYEDFCRSREVFEELKVFVESPIVRIGQAGQFNASNPLRVTEARLHGGKITDARVERWKREKDKDIVREAFRTFDLMPEYVEFWGYER